MIKYKLIHPNAKFGIDNIATSGSAGVDLYTIEDTKLTESCISYARTGVCLDMTGNYETIPGTNSAINRTFALLAARSSLYKNYRCSLSNSVGIIDKDYQGEILVPLIGNCGVIPAGTAIAQLIFMQYDRPGLQQVEAFSQVTERGEGGFGSTNND